MFVTYLFGTKLLPFLHVWLYSLTRNCPHIDPIVFFDDLPSDELRLMQKRYPRAKFWYHPFVNQEEDRRVRVSQKPSFCRHLCQMWPYYFIYVVECDLLILEDPRKFLKQGVDVMFSYRDGNPGMPVNTGVLFFEANFRAENFILRWEHQTGEIFKNPEEVEHVSGIQGGVDQWTFLNIVKHDTYKGEFVLKLNQNLVKFEGVPCSAINRIERPDVGDAHMIHYKGKHQDYFLEGIDRGIKDWEVTKLFMEYWQKARIKGSKADIHKNCYD